ncbi:hypothetical protein ACQBAU_16120 [Propionibacteriaceae bacterium Y2011]
MTKQQKTILALAAAGLVAAAGLACIVAGLVHHIDYLIAAGAAGIASMLAIHYRGGEQ